MAAIEYVRNVPQKCRLTEYRGVLSIALRQSYRYRRTARRLSNNRGRSAPKGQGQKGYERVVTGAVVVKIPYQEIRGSEGP